MTHKQVTLSLRIQQSLDDFLTMVAQGAGTTKSEYIRALIKRERDNPTGEIVVQMTDEQAARMTRIASQYMAYGTEQEQ